jgi:hypothetical protein
VNTRWGSLFLTALLIAQVYAIALPRAAEATTPVVPPDFTGANFHPFGKDYYNVDTGTLDEASVKKVFDKLSAAGVGWIRIDLRWHDAQPSKPSLPNDAPSFDAKYRNAFKQTLILAQSAVPTPLQVLVVITCTPKWDSNKPNSTFPDNKQCMAAPSPADLARFIDRYFGAGGLPLIDDFDPKPYIKAYEIYNEPNDSEQIEWDTALNPPAYDLTPITPSRYVDMMKAVYPDLSRAVGGSPYNASVILGGADGASAFSQPCDAHCPTPDSPPWLDTQQRWLNLIAPGLCSGTTKYFDAWNIHPYVNPKDLPPEYPDTDPADAYARGLLTHVTDVHKFIENSTSTTCSTLPLWITEFGWTSFWKNATSNANQDNSHCGVSDRQQAEYIVRAIKWVRDANAGSGSVNVAKVIDYEAADETSANQPDVSEASYGLLTPPLGLKEKKSYAELKTYLATGVIGQEDEPTAEESADMATAGTVTQPVSPPAVTTPQVSITGGTITRPMIPLDQQDHACRENLSFTVSLTNSSGAAATSASGIKIQFWTPTLTEEPSQTATCIQWGYRTDTSANAPDCQLTPGYPNPGSMGTLTFRAGKDSSKKIFVPVLAKLNDSNDQCTERLFVKILLASGTANITKNLATGKINRFTTQGCSGSGSGAIKGDETLSQALNTVGVGDPCSMPVFHHFDGTLIGSVTGPYLNGDPPVQLNGTFSGDGEMLCETQQGGVGDVTSFTVTDPNFNFTYLGNDGYQRVGGGVSIQIYGTCASGGQAYDCDISVNAAWLVSASDPTQAILASGVVTITQLVGNDVPAI